MLQELDEAVHDWSDVTPHATVPQVPFLCLITVAETTDRPLDTQTNPIGWEGSNSGLDQAYASGATSDSYAYEAVSKALQIREVDVQAYYPSKSCRVGIHNAWTILRATSQHVVTIEGSINKRSYD